MPVFATKASLAWPDPLHPDAYRLKFISALHMQDCMARYQRTTWQALSTHPCMHS